MNLQINQLPSRTWNHLKMNGTQVSLEGSFENNSPKAEFNAQEVLWNEDLNTHGADLHGDLKPLTAEAKVGFGETAANVSMEQPLVLRYAYSHQEQGISHLILHAGKDSHLKTILVLTSPAEASLTSVLQTEIYADEGSQVDLYVMELLGEKAQCFNSISGICGRNARINLIKLELGAGKIYAGANIDLQGEDSSFHTEVGYHVKPDQLLDMNYVAVHHGKRTESLMEVNGTLEEGARKIFRGTIDFRQGCAGAKATENENVMLMGEEMVNQTIPVILCKEEDVEGNHGASIGQLDDKILFYLASRGISREAAQAIIAQARIDAICEKIPVEEIRNQVREFEKVGGISHGEEL